jgi:hypothetical protein
VTQDSPLITDEEYEKLEKEYDEDKAIVEEVKADNAELQPEEIEYENQKNQKALQPIDASGK